MVSFHNPAALPPGLVQIIAMPPLTWTVWPVT